MILMIPLNAITGAKIRNLQLQMMKLKDSRVKLMNEILNGMKVNTFNIVIGLDLDLNLSQWQYILDTS